MIIWYVFGVIGSLLLTYNCWKEGNDIDFSIICFMMVMSFAGFVWFTISIFVIDFDLVLFKGKE